MSHVVLFHSALGLRPAVRDFAAQLAADGHQVTTPDLFDGEVFDDLALGVKKRDALGIEELSRRARAAVEGLPADVVYAGFSMGAAAAQALALTRPGARGVVLMHAVLPLVAFGATAWPAELRGQIHTSVEDPWVDLTVARAMAASATDRLQLFEYAGSAHLFADAAHADFDEAHAAAMTERVRAFSKGA
ncbi:MAG: dienelactone hydrolase family protein [Myxococcales bacterium]|nr:dienelactone hydrolase family protein [Myxococcales bacterium]